MKIADVTGKVFQMRKFTNMINVINKSLECAVPQILHFVHEPAFKLLLWLKMLILQLRHHLYVGKTDNLNCIK